MALYRNRDNGNVQDIPAALANHAIHELVETQPCEGCTPKPTDIPTPPVPGVSEPKEKEDDSVYSRR
jgi:hypothetical protein